MMYVWLVVGFVYVVVVIDWFSGYVLCWVVWILWKWYYVWRCWSRC